MKKLTKKYRLIANSDKVIHVKDEFNIGSVTETSQPYAFDFDTEQEMLDKITELELT